MADGPIQAYFDRHFWPAFASDNSDLSHVASLDLLARSGRDHYHVLVFKDPRSRMIDKSLWVLGLPVRQWSVTGAPFFWRKKAELIIKNYDAHNRAEPRACGRDDRPRDA